jgi:hypothetical protein
METANIIIPYRTEFSPLGKGLEICLKKVLWYPLAHDLQKDLLDDRQHGGENGTLSSFQMPP